MSEREHWESIYGVKAADQVSWYRPHLDRSLGFITGAHVPLSDRGIRGRAAGWHICFDVLDRFLAGMPIGRIVGADALKFGGWQRLNAE